MTSPVEQFPAPSYSSIAIYQDNNFCPRCAGEQIFVQVYEVEGGRWGYCVGCGNERFIWFTHTTAEAA